MKLQLILHMAEKSYKLCGIEFVITWGKELRSRHTIKDFIDIKRRFVAQTKQIKRPKMVEPEPPRIFYPFCTIKNGLIRKVFDIENVSNILCVSFEHIYHPFIIHNGERYFATDWQFLDGNLAVYKKRKCGYQSLRNVSKDILLKGR